MILYQNIQNFIIVFIVNKQLNETLLYEAQQQDPAIRQLLL